MSPKLSVVLSTLNGSIETAFTAGGIMIQCDEYNIPYEIIIVDNGSEQEHINNLTNFIKYHPKVKIRHCVHKGTIPPKVVGAEEATGEYLMFPDSHVLYTPNFFKHMLRVLDVNQSVQVLTAAAQVASFDNSKGNGFNIGHRVFSQTANHEERSDKAYPIFVHMLHGTIVRRDWFFKIGGFFPNSFKEAGGYCAEDMLLFVTTWMFGGKCMVDLKEASFHPVYRFGLPDKIVHDMHGSAPIAYYLLGGEKGVQEIEKILGQKYDLEDIKRQAVDRQWILDHQQMDFFEAAKLCESYMKS